MKCPKCGGTGWDIVHGFDCVSCDGKGEITMTNEEYIRQCSTEELAEWIVKIAFGKEFKTHISKIGYANMHSYKTEVLEWLKEKH